MAWSVDNIYECVKFIIRKNQAGGVTATDLFYAWNTEQAVYHNDLIGRWEARSNGKQGQNTGLIKNEIVLSDLAPFTIPVTIAVTAGKATKPIDYEFRFSLTVNGNRVSIVTADQLPYVNKSVINAPSVVNGNVYATEYQDYYLFNPNTVTTCDLSYVASARDIVWAFIFDADGRQIYDVVNSVQPQWSQDTIITITKRALNNLGVSFKDQDFITYGKTAQATGD